MLISKILVDLALIMSLIIILGNKYWGTQAPPPPPPPPPTSSYNYMWELVLIHGHEYYYKVEHMEQYILNHS